MDVGTVWLVGMMGAGTSTVGALLARKLGVAFVDTDDDVAEQAGRSIRRVFAEEGEETFRRLEREAIERAAERACVVALGGGAIAQPGVAGRLRDTGTLVYLRARASSLVARLGRGEGRPLIEGLEAEARAEKLEALLAERASYYARAEIVVDTDDRSAEAVAEEIARRLGAGA